MHERAVVAIDSIITVSFISAHSNLHTTFKSYFNEVTRSTSLNEQTADLIKKCTKEL